MTQPTMFEVYDPRDDGFDQFWKLFPRDKLRSGRKAGKEKCLHIWRKKQLHLKKDMVLAALMQDIKDVEKGTYQMAVNSTDKLCYFPGIQPWMNQDRWDRDVFPVEQPGTPSKPVGPSDDWKPMTPAEKAAMLPVWRLVAQRRASLWPRKNGRGIYE